MGFIDKAKNAAEDAVGKAKEAIGGAVDDKSLEAEGKKDQGSAGIKKVGENIKDALG
ncbi:CsbD family protein [Rhodococcus qingshengii]|uniref:CsbD family protein n=1 Tax=Rhodococcus qingshengii TaxID=334542 RepID=UPI001ADF872C|nr:CsbD family protein [Rhodococcus qingshengii]